MKDMIEDRLNKLINWCENQEFKGYDPYDTLNSWMPFHWFGNGCKHSIKSKN